MSLGDEDFRHWRSEDTQHRFWKPTDPSDFVLPTTDYVETAISIGGSRSCAPCPPVVDTASRLDDIRSLLGGFLLANFRVNSLCAATYFHLVRGIHLSLNNLKSGFSNCRCRLSNFRSRRGSNVKLMDTVFLLKCFQPIRTIRSVRHRAVGSCQLSDWLKFRET